MLLYSWLSKSNPDHTNPLLPMPVGPKTTTASDNEQVKAEITQNTKGKVSLLLSELRAKMGKNEAEHGNKAAVTKFS